MYTFCAGLKKKKNLCTAISEITFSDELYTFKFVCFSHSRLFTFIRIIYKYFTRI